MFQKSALVLVDLQNDFMPGGALAVAHGDEVIPAANAMMEKFRLTLATKDWHPPGHCSFASSHQGTKPFDRMIWNGLDQTLWPDHCVQNTPGSAFHKGLNTSKIAEEFHKGSDINIESYCAFYDLGNSRSTGLCEYLREHRIQNVYIGGLATDYCVLYTALASCELNFHTFIIRELCRPINIVPADEENAYEKMKQAGARILTIRDLPEGIVE